MTTLNLTTQYHGTLHQPVASMISAETLAVLITKIKLQIERNRQRRQLADMSDEQLHDIGKTREQANAEAQKSFWKK